MIGLVIFCLVALAAIDVSLGNWWSLAAELSSLALFVWAAGKAGKV